MKQTPVAVAFAVACLGIAVFASMDAVMKSLTLALGTYNAMIWRSFIGVPLAGGPWLLRRPRWPDRATLRIHIERGIVCAIMAVLFFWGLARTPMAQAIALTFIAPLIAQGLAVLLLKERMRKGAILGSAIACAGVVMIFSGQAESAMGPEALWGAAAVIASAVAYAYNIILMRRQAQVADPYEVAFFQNLIVAACLSVAMPWLAVFPDVRHLPMILLGAVMSSVSIFLLGWAYARAEASYLAPVEFTAFIWASLWGYVVFGEHVRLTTVAGAALIIAGCIVAARSPANLPERDVVP